MEFNYRQIRTQEIDPPTSHPVSFGMVETERERERERELRLLNKREPVVVETSSRAHGL